VARRFRGESVHKVDAKGRVSIPAAFRRVLEECDPDWEEGHNPNLVLVYGDHRRKFIEGYSMTSMQEVDDKISQLPRGSRERRMLEQMFSGQAVQIQLDETGRLVLSGILVEQEQQVIEGLAGHPLNLVSVTHRDEWTCIVYQSHE